MNISIFHWRAKETLGNFGDALTLLYQARMFEGPCLFRTGTVHLVGSVISDRQIAKTSARGPHEDAGPGRAVFWGCGKRDAKPLPPLAERRAIFLGIRGEHSRLALDLPRNTPLGDTALLLPKFYTPAVNPETAGKVLWVPHVHHPKVTVETLGTDMDSVIMSPAIPNTVAACEAFIDAIASARFVMANAMHAAVVALAYGVPFAFWSGKYLDVPFKWQDFASGVGFTLPFAPSLAEGMRLFEEVRPDRFMAEWDPAPLMEVAPYRFRATA
ncbi:polysaccharide pyruvyl transferase family protein [Ancylobacter oerskovii]|uniref:Polysaccharide pyruvyl transferase family protein n=1 Tax=Ancylobacter oerskovii TaxID=459519 RepID=A0ABW4Z376_9HYPH|nr:polysaccharide pyruvyl transferase family protein [Ancylobacter oerskovii]MBS7546129.1 polysaccharide pyruvyl transferase family protein [Ancylobacter oerskovii]